MCMSNTCCHAHVLRPKLPKLLCFFFLFGVAHIFMNLRSSRPVKHRNEVFFCVFYFFSTVTFFVLFPTRRNHRTPVLFFFFNTFLKINARIMCFKTLAYRVKLNFFFFLQLERTTDCSAEGYFFVAKKYVFLFLRRRTFLFF